MSDRSCAIIRDLLPVYADGLASEASVKIVEEHLSMCPACQKVLDDLRAEQASREACDQEELRFLQQENRRLQKTKTVGLTIPSVVAAGVLIVAVNHSTRLAPVTPPSSTAGSQINAAASQGNAVSSQGNAASSQGNAASGKSDSIDSQGNAAVSAQLVLHSNAQIDNHRYLFYEKNGQFCMADIETDENGACHILKYEQEPRK